MARWVLGEGLLHQFSLAKEQMDRPENVEVNNVVTGEVGEVAGGEDGMGSIEATD